MKKLFTLLFAFTAFFAFQACDDDDEPEPIVNAIVNEVDDIDASAYDEWVYFSFEDGAIVGTSAVEEKRAGLDWDIAFHRWDIRLNCGTSGSGQGGALKSTGNVAKTGWDALTVAPETGYAVDETITVIKQYGMPPTEVDVSGNKVITGDTEGTWVVFDHTNGPSYTVTNQIFVVKTADGKYVKIWLKQYKNAEGKGGHITMKYAYQADGSTKLD